MEEVISQPPIEFQCIEVKQPIGFMYVGAVNFDHLEYISYADVRRMSMGRDNREVEDYIGIQRKLDEKREKVIGKYVNLIDATFPNSIILSISSEHAKYNRETKMMTIDYNPDVAKVLDGQHRIAGLKNFTKAGNEFQCIVTIYVDMELEDQAIVFATINKEQKNVNNSLVADLFSFAESRSPQKTGHNIARALAKKETSPFFKKIKILGTAVDRETITQDTFVKSLLLYISKDPQLDRDFYKRHKDNKDAKLPHVSGEDEKRYFLRNIFIDDDKDVKIAQILLNYFYAVQQKWPNAWGEGANLPNNILNKSTGFIALMRFFKHAYLSFNRIGEVVTKEEFIQIFQPISLTEDAFNRDNYLPGSSGQGKLYKDLLEQSGL